MSTEEFYALPADEQDLWIAKHERDHERCPKCHGDRARCGHPEQPWYPQRSVCYADMETAAASRRYELLHEKYPYHDGTFTSWAEQPLNADGELTHPYHFRDGVTIWVAPVDFSPNEKNFLTDVDAPVPPPQPEGGDE